MFLVIAVIVVIFIITGKISESKAVKKRDEAFADFAVKNGWQKVPLKSYASPKVIGEILGCHESDYSLLKYGSIARVPQIKRAFSKQEGDRLFLFFDMSYFEHVRGSSYKQYDLTAVAVSCFLNSSIPKFALFPRGEAIWREAVKDVHYPGSDMKDFYDTTGIHPLLSHDNPADLRIMKTSEPPAQGMHAPVKLESEAFNERYILHGRKIDDIKRFFDGEVISTLGRLPPTCIDGCGSCLFAFNASVSATPEQLQTFVDEKVSLLNGLIRRHQVNQVS